MHRFAYSSVYTYNFIPGLFLCSGELPENWRVNDLQKIFNKVGFHGTPDIHIYDDPSAGPKVSKHIPCSLFVYVSTMEGRRKLACRYVYVVILASKLMHAYGNRLCKLTMFVLSYLPQSLCMLMATG